MAYKDLTEFLTALGLEQYVSQFEANDITLDVLPELASSDLKDLAVEALGHRKAILAAAKEINAEKPDATPASGPVVTPKPTHSPLEDLSQEELDYAGLSTEAL